MTGQGTVFGGLGTITLKNANPDYSDAISPDATAELAFSGDKGNAGIDKNGGHYRTSVPRLRRSSGCSRGPTARSRC